MKKIITVSAMAMAGMFSAQTLADEGKTGFYVTGKAGASVITQSDQRFAYGEGNNAAKYKGDNKSDTVFGAGLAVGYDFYPHYNVPVRTEVEFYGRGNAMSRYDPMPINRKNEQTSDSPASREYIREYIQNKLSVNTLMLNAYYDFRNSSAFTPWISAGLGYARVHHKAAEIQMEINSSGAVGRYSAEHFSGYENNLAWTLGVGMRYDITPDVALDLSYRYLDAGNSSVSYKDEWGDKYKSEVDIRSHDILFGVTYNF
ncbi:outer membrane protein [Escherichia coli]|uniref:outer membrane protein n=1 Tax=Escherichia coli TaxID=562 RepID=UPI0010EBFF4A|nr:outer membrane beta-barrel protein [Escherichia coli]GDO94853.1 adhesin/virulence factor Hek [Escherichia coli]